MKSRFTALLVIITTFSGNFLWAADFDQCNGYSCCSSSAPNFFCQICCPVGVAASCLGGNSIRIGSCSCGSAAAQKEAVVKNSNDNGAETAIYMSFAFATIAVGIAATAASVFLFRTCRQKTSDGAVQL